eukprot:5866352-Amphidinium_carterae.1
MRVRGSFKTLLYSIFLIALPLYVVCELSNTQTNCSHKKRWIRRSSSTELFGSYGMKHGNYLA